jgi:hypothetical protein
MPQAFFCWLFLRYGHFMPVTISCLDHNPPIYASPCNAMTWASHWLRWGLKNFCLGCLWTTNLQISASRVARIIGVARQHGFFLFCFLYLLLFFLVSTYHSCSQWGWFLSPPRIFGNEGILVVKMLGVAERWAFTSVIPATQEAEIRRIKVQSQPR